MLPFIRDENIATLRDEGLDPSKWCVNSTPGGSVSVAGKFLKIASAGSGNGYYQPITLPTGEDCIIYLKVRPEVGSGKACVVHLANSSAAPLLAFGLNYSYASQTIVPGVLSIWAAGGQTLLDCANFDYTCQWCDLAIHIDNFASRYSVYVRDADKEWLFIHSGALANLSGLSRVLVAAQYDKSAPTYALLDHLLVCYPNLVSFGDSICQGFDRNVAANAETCWQKHARVYPWLRNNLIANLGNSGDSSQQTGARIVSGAVAKARVAFLHASSNDFRLGVSQTDRTSITQQSIGVIGAYGVPCFLLNGIYPNARYQTMDYAAETTYQKTWWDASSPNLTGLKGRIDIMVPVKNSSADNMDRSTEGGDGKHPNIAGHTCIGTFIASVGYDSIS
ncbi:SGNH/GDSL hydrolase family protein [Pseudomonas sp. NY15436]|uniref:SGNH/GDSL hydrolase family protein n=1 Tax=Pseudomonas sp. NY15436 TaxID=3400359 RepID=UPI003A8C0739